MIPEAEIRRTAAQMNIDPMIIDLDYSLGWFILGLSMNNEFSVALRFKGGTCLRKCYFTNYRFSEDLDFTMQTHLSTDLLEKCIQQIIRWIVENDGPNFQIEPIRFEVLDDDYGNESFQARIYYRGPLQWGGSPRVIRVDITKHEKLSLPAVHRMINHPYSDHDCFEGKTLQCYSLEEILSEKLRAIGGQRRYAISRDIYDISNLLKETIDINKVKLILPEKFQAKGIPLSQLNLISLERRKHDFQQDWDRQLRYLVREDQNSFEKAWDNVIQISHEMLDY